MLQIAKKAFTIFIILTFITGLCYPLLITMIAYIAFPAKSHGDIIVNNDNVIIGAKLIGQKFEDNKYFWGRPSASDYNALASGGSNLSLSNATLQNSIKTRNENILKTHASQKEGLDENSNANKADLSKNEAEVEKEAEIEAESKAEDEVKIKVPSELLYASGSGLDPHISPQTAIFQMDRVIQARNLDRDKDRKTIEELINKSTSKPLLNIIGNPVVNVLLLNKALDEAFLNLPSKE